MQMKCQISGLEALQQIADNYPNVIFRALQKTGEQMRTQEKREITEHYNVSSSVVKDAITVSARPNDLAVSLKIRSSRLPLAMFNPKFSRGARSKDRTIFVQIIRGSQVPVQSAFVTGVNTGHKSTMHFGIFKRVGASRLPIQEMKTISPSEMFGSRSVWGKLEEFFYQKFPEILDHEMQFEASRYQ